MKVRDAMTSDITTVTPEDTLKEAAELMAGLNVGLLPERGTTTGTWDYYRSEKMID